MQDNFNKNKNDSSRQNKKNIFIKTFDWCKRTFLHPNTLLQKIAPYQSFKIKYFAPIFLLLILFLVNNTEVSLICDSLCLKINNYIYGKYSTKNYQIVEKLIHKSLEYNKLLLAKKYIIEYNDIAKYNNNLKNNYIPILIIIDILYGDIDSALNTLNEALNIYKEDSVMKNLYLLMYNNKIHNYENLINIYKQINSEKTSLDKKMLQMKIAYVYFLKEDYNSCEQIYLNILNDNNISKLDKLVIYLILAEINIEKNNFIKAHVFVNKYSELLQEVAKETENQKEFISIETIKFNLVAARKHELQNRNAIEIYKQIYEKKIKTFQKAGGHNKKKQANDYIFETYILDKLGDAYLLNNQPEKATNQYLKALKIRQKYIPAFQVCSIEKLNNIGINYKNNLYDKRIINEFNKHNININAFCRFEFEYL